MHQQILNMIFVETALAYELGGDWRYVLQYYKQRCVSRPKEFCEKGLARDTDDLEAAIQHFLMENKPSS